MSEQPGAPEPARDDPDPGAATGEGPAPTGVRAADEAAARLREIDDAPLEQHVTIYEDGHRRLQEGLADLDEH